MRSRLSLLLNPETGSIGKLGPGADRPGDALDPMWTDVGRVRAIESIPKRVRH